MPKIYDNEYDVFVQGLQEALHNSHRADICTAYFNLNVWSHVAQFVDQYSGAENNGQCRLLLGMYGERKVFQRELNNEPAIDGRNRENHSRLKAKAKKYFKEQLEKGNYSHRKSLQQIKKHLQEKKLVVKLYTPAPLHAKLYIGYQHSGATHTSPAAPAHTDMPTNTDVAHSKATALLGSSNFTHSGLRYQGELNIDVPDQQNTQKLVRWFNTKWENSWNIDFSDALLELLKQSWPSSNISPYEVYMKMLYHLKQDAQLGLDSYALPKEFKGHLFEFQSAAVRIAARYAKNEGGVFLGDVVGLGKTRTALAVAKIFEELERGKSLVLCPPNLTDMWQSECDKFNVHARIQSLYNKNLPDTHFSTIIIDESHNLRNSSGKQYQLIQSYIKKQNEAYNDKTKCILLSATPYNKEYRDLSSQLELFLEPDTDLGIKPDNFLLSTKGQSFEKLSSSLAAFRESSDAEDWRRLMDKFLIRRTRSFIKQEYAKENEHGQYYIEAPRSNNRFSNNTIQKPAKHFLPERIAKTIKFKPDSQYKKLFSEETVDTIKSLELPRYGLIKYKMPKLPSLNPKEEQIFKDLERARTQPKGFCRVQLFKRLESSGYAFLKSVYHHVLRNYIFLYAIDNKLPLPIGSTLNCCTADVHPSDTDTDGEILELDSPTYHDAASFLKNLNPENLQHIAQSLYRANEKKMKMRPISSTYFSPDLETDLKADTHLLEKLLEKSSEWSPDKDTKLKELELLLIDSATNPDKKLKKNIVFTQFKDTAEYLGQKLNNQGLKASVITGDSASKKIQQTVRNFSPNSNSYKTSPDDELHILIATDVLSEGQNLQDCGSVINYDLPWAIIKLVQRAGRIDRIGQTESQVYCHTFMPADGVEELLRLHQRLQQRLQQNQEVLGSDEKFFEGDETAIRDLYNEKSSILNDDKGGDDTDLSSYALSLWNKEAKKDESLKTRIPNMSNKVYATKHSPKHEGVLLFAQNNKMDRLVHIGAQGHVLTENARKVLEIARCMPNETKLPHNNSHDNLVNQQLNKMREKSAKIIAQQESFSARSTPRYKLYNTFGIEIQKLEDTPPEIVPQDETKQTPIRQDVMCPGSLRATRRDQLETLKDIHDQVHAKPLTPDSNDALARMYKQKTSHQKILNFAIELHRQNKLVDTSKRAKLDDAPHIVCSLGLSS